MNEKDVLRALKHGDEAALAYIIDQYAAYVSTIVFNIIGASMTVSDVEEVSADVFLTLWMNADRVRPGKVKAYLSGIARNKAKEKTRKMGHALPLEDDIIILSGTDPQHELERREQAGFIRRAILEMDHPDREIFLRHYYYCQTVTRISEETGIHISTVKTRLRRGREKLKDILRKGGYDVENQDL